MELLPRDRPTQSLRRRTLSDGVPKHHAKSPLRFPYRDVQGATDDTGLDRRHDVADAREVKTVPIDPRAGYPAGRRNF
jgi:hypothetical protein